VYTRVAPGSNGSEPRICAICTGAGSGKSGLTTARSMRSGGSTLPEAPQIVTSTRSTQVGSPRSISTVIGSA